MSEPAVGFVSEAPAVSSLPRWPVAVAFIGALLMGAGAVIALVRPEMMLSHVSPVNEGVRIYAGYLVSRNAAVALLIALAAAIGARKALAHFLLLAALVQLFDLGLDCFEGRWPLLPGIALFTILLAWAAARVSDLPFWNRSFWLR